MDTPTNYRSIRTCAAIGRNVVTDSTVPLFSRAEVDLHLGGNASWDQRRAFEWAVLAEAHRLSGDEVTEAYCFTRITELDR